MKKIVALFTTVMLVLTASVTVFAAPNNFISSPSGNEAPELVEYSNSDPNCTAKLEVVSYADRDSLSQSARDTFDKAYNEILNANDLAVLDAYFAKLAKDKNIPTSNLAVSDLFYINCYDCVEHDEHGVFKIKLKSDTFNNFVGLMYFDGTKWQVIKDAALDSTGNYLTFTTKFVGPFAVVVNKGENGGAGSNANAGTNSGTTGNNPQTGDDFSALWIGLMIISVLGLGVVAVIFVKQNRKSKR